MTSPSTAVFTAITGLLAACRAALPDVDVYDGPQVRFPTGQDFVLVGVQDPLSDGMRVAVDGGSQDWIGIMSSPARHRDETFTIWNMLVNWTGTSNDLAACRDRAQANLDAVSTQLRADLTLGGGLPSPGWCGLFVASVEQVADPKGWAVHTSFGVACRARL